jgi:RHS repeat-associated protein
MSSRKTRLARQQAAVATNGKPTPATQRAHRRTVKGQALPGILLVALLLLGIVGVTVVTAARRTPTSAAAVTTAPQPIAKSAQVLVYVPNGQPAWQPKTLATVANDSEFQYAGRLYHIDATGVMRRREYVAVNVLADTDRVYDPTNWRFPESGDVVRFVDSAGRHRFHQIMDRFAAGDRFWFQGVLYAVFADAQSPSGLAYQPAGRVLDVDGHAVSTAEYVARHGGGDAIAQAQNPTQPGYNPAVAAAVAAPASGAPEQLGLMPRLETSQMVAVAASPAAPATGGSLPTDYLFTGQKWDSTTGLYKMGDRYYDPTLGRFISPDSYIPDLTNPQDLNRYSYARNNPLKYSDPTGHFPYTPLPFPDFWLPQAGQALNQLWMRAQPYAYQLAADLSQFAASPQAALALQNAQQMQAHASQMQQAASQAGSTGDPGKFDPKRPFRSLAEKYQYETSGTRFGEELRLQVEVEGVQKTLDVDGVVGNFLHESKFIDAGSSFYTTQIGKLGSGMQVHVMGWKDELYRLSLAAQQHGYQGAKVFINSEEAIRVATEVFGKENWFKYLELIYKLPQ